MVLTGISPANVDQAHQHRGGPGTGRRQREDRVRELRVGKDVRRRDDGDAVRRWAAAVDDLATQMRPVQGKGSSADYPAACLVVIGS